MNTNNQPLFIVTHEATTLMLKKLNNSKFYNVHWLFPSVGTLYIDDNKTFFIENYLRKKTNNTIGYWLTRNEGHKSQGYKIINKNTVCITIPRSYRKEKIYNIKLKNIEFLHQSDKYSLIKGKKFFGKLLTDNFP